MMQFHPSTHTLSQRGLHLNASQAVKTPPFPVTSGFAAISGRGRGTEGPQPYAQSRESVSSFSQIKKSEREGDENKVGGKREIKRQGEKKETDADSAQSVLIHTPQNKGETHKQPGCLCE